MKIFLISASVIFAIVFIIQSFIMASVNKTEEQNYKVIQKDQNFEIRFYPSATFATIKSDAKTYKELSGPGFRKLADYIFGGNEDKTQIAMTSPVQMDINDTVSTMSFVMPSSYNQANLPKPNNPDVILKETVDEYVAAIQFGGFATYKELKFYSEKLQDILKEKGIKTNGNARFLGYNPPFQLIGRRNEIIISIEYK
ncbi:MAG: heme-binding protein [Mariniphaga sp.]